jgi:hypothetical protein
MAVGGATNEQLNTSSNIATTLCIQKSVQKGCQDHNGAADSPMVTAVTRLTYSTCIAVSGMSCSPNTNAQKMEPPWAKFTAAAAAREGQHQHMGSFLAYKITQEQ